MKRLTLLSVLAVAIFASIAWTGGSFTQNTSQTIKVCKNADPADSTPFPFHWSNASGSMPSFTLKAGECVQKIVDIKSAPNVFSEGLSKGWTLSDISCSGDANAVRITGNGDAPGFQQGDNTVAVDSRAPSILCTFTNRGPKPACCNFTMNLSTGQNSGPTDSQWTLNPNSAYITAKHPAWIDLLPARWVQPVNSSTASGSVAAGTFKYIATFDVPACSTGHMSLTGTFAADDTAQAFLDGNPIAGTSCTVGYCFKGPKAPIPLNVASIPAGSHTLRIDVVNGGQFSGLVVNAQLKQVCTEKPSEVIKTKSLTITP